MTRCLTLSILLTLFFSPLSVPDTSSAAQPILKRDGTIEIDGRTFADFNDFHGSSYFREHGYRCGTRPVGGEQAAGMARAVSDCTLALTIIQQEYWPTVTYQLPIWFHVISNSEGEGMVSDAAIEAQVDVLNEDFRALSGSMGENGYDVRIQFELAGITRTVNDNWYQDNDEFGYKSALQKDPQTAVNVYTNSASGYLGYAYLPQDIASGAVSPVMDGIVLYWQSVGGRNNGYENYDQGRTLVHEMGHYLGLLHTFEGGGCFNSYTTGDLLIDTGGQDLATATCVSRSSCADKAPIHNYMDYSYDSCMAEFTREQANRSVCSLVNLRPSIYQVIPAPPDGEDSAAAIFPLLLPLFLQDSGVKSP